MDDAYNIQRLINVYQMSKDEVAKTYGMSLSWVVGRLDLIEATPAVEAQIRKGTIKGPAARTIAKLSKEQQSNLAKIAEEKGKVTPADIRREVGAPEKLPTPPAAPTGQQEGIPSTAKPEFFNLAVQFIRAYLSDPQELTPSDLDKLGLDALHAAGLKI
jgi:hypothetical protein